MNQNISQIINGLSGLSADLEAHQTYIERLSTEVSYLQEKDTINERFFDQLEHLLAMRRSGNL